MGRVAKIPDPLWQAECHVDSQAEEEDSRKCDDCCHACWCECGEHAWCKELEMFVDAGDDACEEWG